MGLFETLKSKLTTGKLKEEQIDRLQHAIWTAVSDGVIDDRELIYINGFYTDSELSQDDFDKLRAEIFRSVRVSKQAANCIQVIRAASSCKRTSLVTFVCPQR